MKAWLNGKLVDWSETNVPLLSHSFSRASAIFEVVDISPTLNGPVFFGLREHIKRFFNSARLIYMDIPLTEDNLMQAAILTARENKVTAGICKFFAYYADVEIHPVPTNPKVSLAIFCADFDFLKMDQQQLSAPITAGISSFRKNHPESVSAQAKVTGNYLNAYLASMEIRNRGFQEAIMLDTMGFVAEAPTSNLFFVKERKVVTPNLRCILPGITRTVAIKVLREMKYIVDENDFKVEELQQCDEAFLASSVAKIRAIRSLEGRKLGDTCPGPVTTVLINKINEIYEGRDKSFSQWLTIIR